jgi:hypothetical protein
MKRAMLPIALLGAMSSGCVPAHVEPASITAIRDYSATYLCDGVSIQVRFMPFKADLASAGASVEMTQQPAGDDFLYTAGAQILRAHGDDATWIDDKGGVHNCHVTALGTNR